MEAPPSPSFKPFSRLPLELRRQIWELAHSFSDAVPGVCVLPEDFDPHADQLTVHNPHSALMGTNHEARQIALDLVPLERKYNPETDILYVGSDAFYRFCDMCREDDWPSVIRHLALALPVAEKGLWLPIAMERLDKLQKISVVYPKATGKVDLHDDVVLPNEAHKVLRTFTADEIAAFRISADYIYETHGGDIPIVWTKSTSEHLDFVRGELTRWARQEKPPCWDEETDRLRLAFDARCFGAALSFRSTQDTVSTIRSKRGGADHRGGRFGLL
ncbi:hypothetical protein EDB81DRAFT_841082 [Dactylonectria macrodidyma]|uniref:2EXR domain-containing protein n=1 Tax=Dactylonectria macrodidyma TaxID=307937 RepID=A0A9P9F5F0_9HYPO|nr:hypothetical protein EDB81DRAFT_841082 [Dactylonectria macrodidyma]